MIGLAESIASIVIIGAAALVVIAVVWYFAAHLWEWNEEELRKERKRH
jgi:hypothetical protein